MQVDDPRHGTSAGYSAHLSAGQETCRPCKDAVARYRRGRDWDALRGEPRSVAAIGAQRRLQALSRIGYPIAELVRHTGMCQGPVQQIRSGSRAWIRRSSHDAIAATYERLSMTAGPSNSSRIRAGSRGWLPPLAWDDIDDPDEQPHPLVPHSPDAALTCTDAASASEPRVVTGRIVGEVGHCDDVDEVVVIRILNGDYRLRANVAEKAEVCRRWRGSMNDLERFTGWNIRRYTKEAA